MMTLKNKITSSVSITALLLLCQYSYSQSTVASEVLNQANPGTLISEHKFDSTQSAQFQLAAQIKTAPGERKTGNSSEPDIYKVETAQSILEAQGVFVADNPIQKRARPVPVRQRHPAIHRYSR